MIIKEDDVLLDISINNKFYSHLSFLQVMNLLEHYVSDVGDLEPMTSKVVHGVYMYFSCDEDRHRFYTKIYKTMHGTDRWILFMKDENEGYAIYMNSVTNKIELSWYNRLLNEPLNKEEERKRITCYVPDIMY